MTDTPALPPLDSMLCFDVYALHLAFGRFYQTAFGETGFTYPKFVALLALEEAGSISLSDLAARVGTEANTLSPMIKKMSEFGLIDRVRDPKDERRVLLTLKPFGLAVLQEAQTVAGAAWAALDMDPEAMAQASKALADLRRKLSEATPPLIMKIPKEAETG